MVRRLCALLIISGATLLGSGALVAHSELDEQIARLTAQIIRDPANADLLTRRAELYRIVRDYEKALGDLNRVRQLGSTNVDAELVRARVCLDTGNTGGAVEATTRVLSRQPQRIDAAILRGRARVRLGQIREAAADFTQALQQKPVPDFYIERARAIALLGTSGAEEAVRGLDDGIRRLGPIVTLELEAIKFELQMSRYDSALNRIDVLSAQTARKENWLARRGEILEAAGRLDDARRAYEAALAAARALPPWIRQNAASSALIERVRADVARLDHPPLRSQR
ncbi:MAG TPA: tetratricopeptide repeat protein [Vicinamibacterales bacterium]|nr:tetratricopeptide repeat protein [Vicinamibacterales bacterium]